MQIFQEYLVLIVKFANDVLLPGLFALSFIYFALNMFKLFVQEAASDEYAERKQAVIYSIAALVLIISFWGLINFFTRGLGAFQKDPITPDYIDSFILK